MLYTALVADITNSKKFSKNERKQIQIFIKMCLENLNSIFKPSIKFDVIFSAGDEFQGLFASPIAAFLYLRLLKMILSPVQIRCGIGVGKWDVRIPDGTSSEQDGSAYHNARIAISNAHDKSDYSVLLNSNSENDIFINALMNISFLFAKKQSTYQNELLLLTEMMFPLFSNEIIDIKSFPLMFKLLNNKTDKDFYVGSKSKSGSKINLINSILPDFEPLNLLSSSILKKKLIISETWKKGYSTKIANITNTTRQNIDNIIKSGNIIEIRNIDATTLLLIDKTFGG